MAWSFKFGVIILGWCDSPIQARNFEVASNFVANALARSVRYMEEVLTGVVMQLTVAKNRCCVIRQQHTMTVRRYCIRETSLQDATVSEKRHYKTPTVSEKRHYKTRLYQRNVTTRRDYIRETALQDATVSEKRHYKTPTVSGKRHYKTRLNQRNVTTRRDCIRETSLQDIAVVYCAVGCDAV